MKRKRCKKFFGSDFLKRNSRKETISPEPLPGTFDTSILDTISSPEARLVLTMGIACVQYYAQKQGWPIKQLQDKEDEIVKCAMCQKKMDLCMCDDCKKELG